MQWHNLEVLSLDSLYLFYFNSFKAIYMWWYACTFDNLRGIVLNANRKRIASELIGVDLGSSIRSGIILVRKILPSAFKVVNCFRLIREVSE